MKRGADQVTQLTGLCGGLCNEAWWLDYIEGEYDSDMRGDSELLLTNSPGDRKRLDKLVKTRKLVRESDEVELPEDGRIYDLLHDKIMAAVEKLENGVSTENRSEESEDLDETITVKSSWPVQLWSGLWRRWTVSESF